MIAPVTSTASPLNNLFSKFTETKTEEAENALWIAIFDHLRNKTYEYRLTGDNELLSKTVEKIHARLHLFNPAQGKLESWLFEVIRNAYLDMLRYTDRHPVEDIEKIDEAWQNARSSGGYSEQARWFPRYGPTPEQWDKIRSWKDKCIISSMLARRTLAEAASYCGVSEKTARNRMSRLKMADNEQS